MLAARHRSNKFVVVPYLVTATRCTLLVLRYSYIMYIVKKLCGSVVPLTLQYRDEHVCAWIFSIESLNFINTSPLAVLSIRCENMIRSVLCVCPLCVNDLWEIILLFY